MSLKTHLGTVLCRGRYKAIVHSGHELDADGRILRHGEIKSETPFGKNLITKLGFDYSLGRTGLGAQPLMVCGPSSSPVSEDDVLMGDAFGYASQFASSTITASNANPDNGPLFQTVEHRRTFPPGSLGATPVVISKAGIVLAPSTTPALAQVRAASLLSAGLLIDHLGNPTSVAVLPTDFLDIVWEYTEFVAYEVAGEMPFTINGVSAPLTYVVRPLNLWSPAGIRSWPALGNGYFNFSPAFQVRSALGANNNGATCVVASELEVITTFGEIAAGSMRPSTLTAEPYVNGSKRRKFTAAWAPSQGNASPAVRRAIVAIGLNNNMGAFQVQFDPPIPKDATRQLELTFELVMANAP